MIVIKKPRVPKSGPKRSLRIRKSKNRPMGRQGNLKKLGLYHMYSHEVVRNELDDGYKSVDRYEKHLNFEPQPFHFNSILRFYYEFLILNDHV